MVGTAMQFAILYGDRVVDLCAGHERLIERPPKLDTFHGVNAAYCAHQLPVEFAIIVDMRSQSGRHTKRHHFDDPAERVFCLDRVVDHFVHSLSCDWIRAADLAGFGGLKSGYVIFCIR